MVRGLSAGWQTCSHTVLLGSHPQDLSYWNNTIAVGSRDGDIIILDAITGSKTAVLSGHTDEVNCVTFSSDGKLLVSGSDDGTAKLWDMQSGGVSRTFSGHTDIVLSVSISPDLTTVASGSEDKTICLWSSQSGECYCVIEQQDTVGHISFYLTGLQHLLSICNDTVWQWDISGHEVGPRYDGSHVAFSSDGAQFAICNGTVVTVRNSSSRVVVATFHIVSDNVKYCCFSPDGRLVAVAVDVIAYVWDITSSEPHCIETFSGHSGGITSLTFSSPSSLISASWDESVKFWQIGLPSDPVGTNPEPASLTSAKITSITLQAKDGITLTSNSDGVVRTWDISTGHCKASIQIPVDDFDVGDAQLINGKLTLLLDTIWKVGIWDIEKREFLWTIDKPDNTRGLKISGDGSRVFILAGGVIQAQSMQTGEMIGKAELKNSNGRSFAVNGSRVWVPYLDTGCLGYWGWDFGIPGSLPVQLPDMPTLCLNDTLVWDTKQSSIKDRVTGKVFFQLSRGFGKLYYVQWNGHFLAACLHSTEVLILDFTHVPFQ